MIELWNCNEHNIWLEAENHYYSVVRPENMEVELKLNNLSCKVVENMTTEEFFDFLYNEYFVWKYTAKNRLATTRNNLIKYKSNMRELHFIKQELFSFDPSNIEYGLKIAIRIKGLGPAGASGLLSILFPDYFGTVDQFLVVQLQKFLFFKENTAIQAIKPEAISIKDAVFLENILKSKASELNTSNNTDYWSPRKIDKVLWSLNR